MSMFLHKPESENNLSAYYKRAFLRAIELQIVNAYLTEWDNTYKLSKNCSKFLFIIGKDFGLTRITACKKVRKWLPNKFKTKFMVADDIENGFHPKAVFWKESDGRRYAIIGSSNLTRAAFSGNYEANIFVAISEKEYADALEWIEKIAEWSHSVTPVWLSEYKEAKIGGNNGGGYKKKRKSNGSLKYKLPTPKGMKEEILGRRNQIRKFQKYKSGLTGLFNSCGTGKISSDEFYTKLGNYWGSECGDRLQGKGWEIKGKNSDFRKISESLLKILKAPKNSRDDVVEHEIDKLYKQKNSARKAFLSEMLCLYFPDEYPVWNEPVQSYLREIKLQTPRGASKGAKYVDIARNLRLSLRLNPGYPAKNLAELDAVIWLHRKNHKH